MLLPLRDLGNISRQKMRVISVRLQPGSHEAMGASLPGAPTGAIPPTNGTKNACRFALFTDSLRCGNYPDFRERSDVRS